MARSNWKLRLSALSVAGIALAAMPVLAKDEAPAGTSKAETSAAPLAGIRLPCPFHRNGIGQTLGDWAICSENSGNASQK